MGDLWLLLVVAAAAVAMVSGVWDCGCCVLLLLAGGAEGGTDVVVRGSWAFWALR